MVLFSPYFERLNLTHWPADHHAPDDNLHHIGQLFVVMPSIMLQTTGAILQ